jgi:DNA (cytosine-5)-methyltransferase 1
MKYLSLFSGIEAVSVAWEKIGFECVALAEILEFQSEILKHHFPNTPNLGDVTKIDEDAIKKLGRIDIVVFGSPCQDMSVAGKRQGLNAVKEDTNHSSKLFFEGVRIFRLAQKHCGARFMLWENVYGALISQEGRDFGTVLETLVGAKFNNDRLVWGNEGVVCGGSGMCEWAVLDAQWFGVPQRRRRVFALLDTGDWKSRRPILLEAEHLRQVNKTNEIKREENSQLFIDSFDRNFRKKPIGYEQLVQTFDRQGVASTVSARDYKSYTDLITYSIPENVIDRQVHTGGNGDGFSKEICYTLNATGVHAIVNQYQVRRLTPIETERLQGFPDNWTKIGRYSNAKRYNALGRSMAVPVMKWIGKQIKNSLLN